MANLFDRYAQEKQLIYDPLMATLENSPEEYLGFLEYLLLKETNIIIDVGKNNSDDISYIVNACCYGLINYLNLNKYDRDNKPESLKFLSRLLNLLESAQNSVLGDYLIPFFERKGENAEDTAIVVPSHYERLEQLLAIYSDRSNKSAYFTASIGKNRANRQLSRSIERYPSLYADVLGTEANIHFKAKFAKEKTEKTKQYTLALYRHLRHELSGGQSMAEGMIKSGIIKGKNPTQLDKEELVKSVDFFAEVRKLNMDITATKLRYIQSAEQLKWELGKTIIDLIPERYSQSFFGQRLMNQLTAMFPSHIAVDSQKLSTVISRLLSFLVIGSDKNHYIFIDLLSNIGSKRLLGILTNLTRLCPDKKEFPLKAEVDRRLAMLFKHYGDYPEQEVQWLIKLLENYNIATSLVFENFDVQSLQLLIKRDKRRQKNHA